MKRPKWLGGKGLPPEMHPELPPPSGPLREFVYLDEISVISLVASRRGAVPEAVTRSESARDAAELNSKIAANVGVLKCDVGSDLSSESTRGVTTVAKSVVQATFKDLLELEQSRLRLRPLNGNLPRVEAVDELRRIASEHDHSDWVLAPDDLRRGDPLELEVVLEADPLFRMNTVINEGVGLLVNMLDEAGTTREQLATMQRFSTILERLLAGLVPLRGRAVSYGLVEVEGADLVIHRRLAERLALPVRELTLVGVAARELFWKDLRRILFSGAEYTVFCRVGRSGIQRSWNPVKLVEAMQEVAPQMGDQMRHLSSLMQTAMQTGAQQSAAEGSREAMLRRALLSYAKRAGAEAGVEIDSSELMCAGVVDESQLSRHAGPEDWRESFKVLDDALRRRFELELSADQALALRSESLREVGLLEGQHAEPASQVDQPSHAAEWLLEVEPIAIYW